MRRIWTGVRYLDYPPESADAGMEFEMLRRMVGVLLAAGAFSPGDMVENLNCADRDAGGRGDMPVGDLGAFLELPPSGTCRMRYQRLLDAIRLMVMRTGVAESELHLACELIETVENGGSR